MLCFFSLEIGRLLSYITNKRPMGHIAHLRKQFKSLNKYDYIIMLIQRIKKKLYENLLVLHLNKLESTSPKDALCQNWLKLAQWFWRRRWKCEKFTDRQTDGRTDGRTDRQTDDGRQVIRKAHLSFQLRWAKNYMLHSRRHKKYQNIVYI